MVKTKRKPLPGHILDAALAAWSQAGEQHVIPITGQSMHPIFQDGDRVLITHGCTGTRRGDVVVFRQQGKLVAHRVLRIYKDDEKLVLITKGDNAPHLDPPLRAEQVVGQVLAVERGSQRMDLTTAAWRILGWLIAIGTLAWTALYRWSRALKRRFLGPRPNRITAFLRQSAQAVFRLALQAAQAAAGRWKRDDSSPSNE